MFIKNLIHFHNSQFEELRICVRTYDVSINNDIITHTINEFSIQNITILRRFSYSSAISLKSTIINNSHILTLLVRLDNLIKMYIFDYVVKH